MRIGIVFNPSARGEQARRFLAALQALAPGCDLFPTRGPGCAAQLAAAACQRGIEILVAAGGDGTVSEVADGMASIPGALEAVRLAIIPLGTINVFARELGIPRRIERAWQVIRDGRELRVDLPRVELHDLAAPRQRHFVQLAGCGLDSRAIAAVNWDWKKRVGPLAYVGAALGVMRGAQPRVGIRAGNRSLEGELVLVGNGRFYAGDVTAFPGASLHDGVLDARVFPRVTLLTLCRFGLAWLARRPLSRSVAAVLQGTRFELTSPAPLPVEVDGDNVGFLPATFTVPRERLRVLVPRLPTPGAAPRAIP